MKYYTRKQIQQKKNISRETFQRTIKEIKPNYTKDQIKKIKNQWRIREDVLQEGVFDRKRKPKITEPITKWVHIVDKTKWSYFITITPGNSSVKGNMNLLDHVFQSLQNKYKIEPIIFFGVVEETPQTNNERHHIHFLLKLNNTNCIELEKWLEKDYKEGTIVKPYEYPFHMNYTLLEKTGNYKEHYTYKQTRKT